MRKVVDPVRALGEVTILGRIGTGPSPRPLIGIESAEKDQRRQRHHKKGHALAAGRHGQERAETQRRAGPAHQCRDRYPASISRPMRVGFRRPSMRNNKLTLPPKVPNSRVSRTRPRMVIVPPTLDHHRADGDDKSHLVQDSVRSGSRPMPKFRREQDLQNRPLHLQAAPRMQRSGLERSGKFSWRRTQVGSCTSLRKCTAIWRNARRSLSYRWLFLDRTAE